VGGGAKPCNRGEAAMAEIRSPAVAGTFYPADASRLRAAVESHLAAAGRPHPDRPPKAVIAPHAGYAYSGPVAGHAFASMSEGASQIRRIVVIGPAHFVPFRGIAVPGAEVFRTPLGDVPVDRDAIEMILDLPQVRAADRPHEPEHALEVELPFLQTVLNDFSLVPLLVGDATPAAVAEVLSWLWGGAETWIVISSDLSHYHDYGTARRLDAGTAHKIEALDESGLGPYAACGHLPIAGLLIEAKRRAMQVERLDLRNSGDTAGPKDRVVGYGAWSFCGP
jgi:AmmeMemoRadiSam system protein B